MIWWCLCTGNYYVHLCSSDWRSTGIRDLLCKRNGHVGKIPGHGVWLQELARLGVHCEVHDAEEIKMGVADEAVGLVEVVHRLGDVARARTQDGAPLTQVVVTGNKE